MILNFKELINREKLRYNKSEFLSKLSDIEENNLVKNWRKELIDKYPNNRGIDIASMVYSKLIDAEITYEIFKKYEKTN